MTLNEQIDDFSSFAKEQSAVAGEESIDVLYEQWRQRAFGSVDALAVQASLRDLEQGERGQPLDEFLAEFDARQQPKPQ